MATSVPQIEARLPIAGSSTASRSASAARFYRRELDGLRFVAFLLVFGHHAFPQVAGGWRTLGFGDQAADWLAAATTAGGHGVDLFFALSSYLVTELLLREQDRFGELSPWRFWARRALRIWPLYFAFVLLCSGIVPGFHFNLKPVEVLAFLLMVGNWHVAWFGYPVSVAAPLWSVSIEEQFYVAWPWLLRRGGRGRLLAVCVVMLLVGLVTRGFLALRETPPHGVWCNTFARLDAIAMGALVAAWDRKRPLVLDAWWRFALWLLAPALIIIVTFHVPVSLPRASGHHVWSYLVIDLAACGLLVASLRPANARARLLGSVPLVYLGRISYGLYVFHALGLKLADGAIGRLLGPTPMVVRALIALAATVALASASYYVLERPFLKLKARFARVESRPD